MLCEVLYEVLFEVCVCYCFVSVETRFRTVSVNAVNVGVSDSGFLFSLLSTAPRWTCL